MEAPPPPPPPHGDQPPPRPSHSSSSSQHPGSGLPPGNYDIFVIPPHASGGGFLYLPSLQPHMNSFIAGCACTFVVIYIYNISKPLLRELYGLAIGNGGGLGMVGLILAVGVGAWAFGKMQAESKTGGAKFGGAAPGGGAGASGQQYQQQQQQQHSGYAGGPPPTSGYQAPPPQPGYQAPPPQPGAHSHAPPPQPQPQPQAQSKPPPSGWEKAREETRRREEERKRAEELKKRREGLQKAREEAERLAKIKAEQEKWEQQRAREKEKREREARERIAKERLEREKIKLEQAKEQREKDAREREAREKIARDKAEWEKKRQAEKEKSATPTKPHLTTPSDKYERPTAKSASGTEEAHSYRPYDTPKKASTYNTAASSISGLSESSYAPSHSTARTTPPPSHRGPYSTSDPHKIQIKAVYLFSDKSPLRPISQLVSGQGPVTDGLILNIETEGLFIDDDVRDVPQREWDVKAWSLKLVEEGSGKNGLHLFRACSRDVDNKKYFFILDQSEAWKVTAGVARLRKGSQVRSLGFNTIKEKDVKEVLNLVGWL